MSNLDSASPTLSDLGKLLPNERLPLGAIAQMPFPLSMVAMRRYYCADWHKPEPDGETPGRWKVRIDYHYRSEEVDIFEVEALTQEEAWEAAEKEFDSRHRYDEAEIDGSDVEFLGVAQ